MTLRAPSVAGSFYPEHQSEAIGMLELGLKHAGTIKKYEDVRSIVVPHAGWVFSSIPAIKAFASLATPPDLVIFFGAVHHYGVPKPAIYPSGAWQTPLGDAEIDEEAAELLYKNLSDRLTLSEKAHRGEHSIEVNLPFAQYFYPKAKILPIAMPPDENDFTLGGDIAELLSKTGKKLLFVASSDLTHYGRSYGFMPPDSLKDPHKWAKEQNDGKLIELMVAMNGEHIVPYTELSGSACGGGAIAAAIGAAKSLGATRGKLLDYRTSSDAMRAYGISKADFVCYASVIYR